MPFEGSASGMSNDSQFSIVKVLKPFPDFETVYQGKTHTTPVAFPGTLDPQAGQEGYASTLLAGIPVPLGAQLQIWVPACFTPDGSTQVLYRYEFVFRLRSLRDFRNPAAGAPRPLAPCGTAPRSARHERSSEPRPLRDPWRRGWDSIPRGRGGWICSGDHQRARRAVRADRLGNSGAARP